MIEVINKRGRWYRFLIALATICLALSVLSVAYELVEGYNASVANEQYDKKMAAEHGRNPFTACSWGVNYSQRNRQLIFVLCVAGFCLALPRRTFWFSLSAYGLTLPLIYQWITMMVRDLAGAELYRPDTPYLLKIATQFDWLLFMALVTTFAAGTLAIFLNPKLK